ncbi:MAG: single-stranded-DNA-specific exonuclease RecJ, partial [Burkholderiales bacterium]|nr:single-stranded-DNA-specific exonuclease RecJ [Burkholderiales bacterium]
DLVSKRAPGLLLRFGGHAAAAGLTLRPDALEPFRALLESAVRELADPAALARVVETDGSLEVEFASLEVARMLERETWGQGFPQPVFADEFAVQGQKLVGERHLKLRLARQGRSFDAMLFRRTAPVPERIRGAYRLAIDEFNGAQAVQLTLEHWENP